MTPTETVREELSHLECTRECCARSELCAAILLSGGISFRGLGRYGLSITVNRASASRYYFSLIKKSLGITPLIRTGKVNRLGEQSVFELVFPDESVNEALSRLQLTDPEGFFGIRSRPAPELIDNPCCKAAFLKSAFLITGCLSNPEKEYSLTLTCAGEDTADCVCGIMASLDIHSQISLRRSRYVVYVKDAESISVFLTLTGAHTARLNLENTRIVKQLRNETNRLTNCDNNNIGRTVSTAARRAEDIRFLAQTVGMDKLPEWAREIASLRLENPDTPLSELGELCDPPIGKSGVNNRLRRISEWADKLRADKP